MKIELFPPEDKIEKVVFLKLEKKYDKISLLACNRSGEMYARGILLTISDNGKISRPYSFNSKCGFKRNDLGQVIVD